MSKNDTLWRVVSLFGIGSGTENKRRIHYCLLFSLYMFAHSVISALTRWSDVILRYRAVEDAEYTLYCTCVFLEHTFWPQHMLTLISIVDQDYYDYKLNATPKKIELIRIGQDETKRQLDRFFKMMAFFFTNFAVPPLFLGLYTILTEAKSQISLTDLSLPYECWLPIQVDIYLAYFIIYGYSLLYAFVCFNNIIFSMGSTIGAMHHLTTEIKLFTTSIKEMDNITEISEGNGNYQIEINQARVLRVYMRQLIEHHNLIIRDLTRINKAVSLSSLNINHISLVITALSLYWSLEAQDLFEKLKYTVSFILMLLLIFSYMLHGQIIQNEDENMRNALFECTWLEKPRWFRDSLKIMMIRATKQLQIKPFGLYILNFDTYASIMNAAYAFCNLLRTFRGKN